MHRPPRIGAAVRPPVDVHSGCGGTAHGTGTGSIPPPGLRGPDGCPGRLPLLPRPPQCDVRLPIWRTLGWRTPDLPQPAACRSICSCVSCCADDAPALLSLLAGSYPITSTLTRAATPLAFTTLHPIVIPHRTALPRPLELIPPALRQPPTRHRNQPSRHGQEGASTHQLR